MEHYHHVRYRLVRFQCGCVGVLVAGEEKWKELFVWEGDFVWCEETRGGDCDEDDAYDERSQVQFRPLIYVSCQFEPGEKLFFFS